MHHTICKSIVTIYRWRLFCIVNSPYNKYFQLKFFNRERVNNYDLNQPRFTRFSTADGKQVGWILQWFDWLLYPHGGGLSSKKWKKNRRNFYINYSISGEHCLCKFKDIFKKVEIVCFNVKIQIWKHENIDFMVEQQTKNVMFIFWQTERNAKALLTEKDKQNTWKCIQNGF